MRTSISGAAFLLAVVTMGQQNAGAEIAFSDVTEAAGISAAGPTAGASWGDFNGDGMPDLWVGNHNIGNNAPNLYINRGEGRFEDVAPGVISVSPEADMHGATWVDYDNDGDQDLFVQAGGGGGRGSSPNLLFENREGRLRDRAASAGLDYPLARGRTPLWFDLDGDGLLDVLLMNVPRADGKAPTAIFVQRDGRFEIANKEYGFPGNARPLQDSLDNLLSNVSRFKFGARPGSITSQYGFAALTRFSDIEGRQFVMFSEPVRVFSFTEGALQDVTNEVLLDDVPGRVQDAAIQDFNGDLAMDMFLTIANPTASGISWDGDREIRANFKGAKMKSPRGMVFAAQGPLEFEISHGWGMPPREPPDLYIGSERRALGALGGRVSATPEQARVDGPVNPPADGRPWISISFDGKTGKWQFLSTIKRVGVIVRAQSVIEGFSPIGITSEGRPGKGALLLADGDDGLENPGLFQISGPGVHCHNAAAGDFDNDMDLDLYLVCTAASRNVPNVLLENDGKGGFSVVEGAGGAPGGRTGRGDVVATADYDLDGYLDVFVTNGFHPMPFAKDGKQRLYRNQGKGNHWLQIDLEGARSNRDGIGAVVTLSAGGRKQVRVRDGGMHSFAQNNKRLHFGLGPHEMADEIRVEWPSGAVQTLSGVNADQVLVIREKQ